MTRILLGGLLGGVAMWIVGFIFWGTPLSMLATSNAGDSASVAIQAVLAQHLGPNGSGAYPIPWPGTPLGTQAYGEGPIAMVLFNTNGFALPDTAALVGGLVLGILCAGLLAFALARLTIGMSFAQRLTAVGLFAIAFTAYSQLGQPVFNHAPWGYFIYSWISEVAGWLAAGAVIAWMLPKPAAPQT
ncbi:hypothetical protein [Sphingomonas sp.]|jgi:hypothetical protein|uniref:hypothetical protein n=1 Tax=Sphingomonas sp. TaxID=28214 RepID=UPI002E108C82|nr:hypothetical protein [Sphingomonas sp.]